MNFKILLSSCLISTFFQCSLPKEQPAKEAPPVIGPAPGLFVTSFQSSIVKDNDIVTLDHAYLQLLHFQLEPFELKSKIPLPFAGDQKLLVGSDMQFFVIFQDKDFAIMKSDGQSQVNPLLFNGVIETAAYDDKKRILLVGDNAGTFGLFQLAGNGDVEKMWDAGPIFSDNRRITGGAMVPGGRLMFILDEKTAVLADCQRSLEEQRWVYEELARSDETSLDLILVDSRFSQKVILKSGQKISLYDFDTKKMSTELNLADYKNITWGYEKHPHVIAKDEQQKTLIVYLDGQGNLTQKRLAYAPGNIHETWFNAEAGQITFVTQQGETYLSRYRMEDSRLLDKKEVSSSIKFSVTQNYLFLNHGTALGYVERLTFSRTEDRQALSGFNMENYMNEN